MPRNPILEEIYAARDNLLADHNGDVHAYVLDARKRALASGHSIAVPKQRAGQRRGAAVVEAPAVEVHSSPLENR